MGNRRIHFTVRCFVFGQRTFHEPFHRQADFLQFLALLICRFQFRSVHAGLWRRGQTERMSAFLTLGSLASKSIGILNPMAALWAVYSFEAIVYTRFRLIQDHSVQP